MLSHNIFTNVLINFSFNLTIGHNIYNAIVKYQIYLLEIVIKRFLETRISNTLDGPEDDIYSPDDENEVVADSEAPILQK